MNRALLLLLVLNNKSMIRRSLRGARTWRGAFLLLFTLGFFAITIVPQIFAAFVMRNRHDMQPFTEVFQPTAPLALMAFTLIYVFTSAGEVAVYFTPAEVDFLFAAPFGRRELLLYKVAKTVLGLVVFSAFMSLMMLANLRSWLSGFVGLFLALAMVQFVGMIAALVGQIVSEAAYTRGRKLLLLAVAIAAIVGLSQAGGQIQARGFPAVLETLRESPAFRVLLAPFSVFTKTIFAGEWYPDLLGWGAGALAIDVALLMIVLRLDADYLEAAAAISQKVFERVRRAKQGGGFAVPAGAKARRTWLPDFPWLAGAGPIGWRQSLIVLRTSRHLLLISAIIVAMAVGGMIVAPKPSPGAAGPWMVPGFGVAMTLYITFIFSMQLPWAFRGDLDHIENLKTLPVGPGILAFGELTGGVLMLTAIQVAIFAMLAVAAPRGWPLLVTASVFCLPFDAIILGTNNLLFLIYPVRQPPGTTFDVQMFGKMMLFFFLQMVVMLPLFGLPAGLGAVAYFLAGGSWIACLATAWALLAVEVVPVVLGIAWAFARFDVSTQTPA